MNRVTLRTEGEKSLLKIISDSNKPVFVVFSIEKINDGEIDFPYLITDYTDVFNKTIVFLTLNKNSFNFIEFMLFVSQIIIYSYESEEDPFLLKIIKKLEEYKKDPFFKKTTDIFIVKEKSKLYLNKNKLNIFNYFRIFDKKYDNEVSKTINTRINKEINIFNTYLLNKFQLNYFIKLYFNNFSLKFDLEILKEDVIGLFSGEVHKKSIEFYEKNLFIEKDFNLTNLLKKNYDFIEKRFIPFVESFIEGISCDYFIEMNKLFENIFEELFLLKDYNIFYLKNLKPSASYCFSLLEENKIFINKIFSTNSMKKLECYVLIKKNLFKNIIKLKNTTFRFYYKLLFINILVYWKEKREDYFKGKIPIEFKETIKEEEKLIVLLLKRLNYTKNIFEKKLEIFIKDIIKLRSVTITKNIIIDQQELKKRIEKKKDIEDTEKIIDLYKEKFDILINNKENNNNY